ncbi:hypothetical protein EDD86DRAFT_273010 [Gorgonomyces haynaldii]|nr:hypothetical protein EDD86DRAFT_273010 [Gorgonomyces haynaldii]
MSHLENFTDWVKDHWKVILVAAVATGLTAGVIYSQRKPLPKKTLQKANTAPAAVETPEKTESPKEAESPKEQLVEEDKSKLANDCKIAGNKLYAERKFQEAIEKYSEAIDLLPSAVFFSNRAACYANTQQYEKVVEDCTSALKIDPKYIKALNRRAQAFENLGQFKDALNDYTVICVLENFRNEASMAAPDRILKQLASVRTQEILKTKTPKMPSETFISAYMDSFRALPHISTLLIELAGDLESSALLREAGEKVNAREWTAAYELVNKSLSLEEFESSKAQALALNLRGTFHFLMGQVDLAIQDIDASLQLDAENVNTIIKRATLFMEMGELEQTVQQFDLALQLAPNHVDLFYHRGQVRFLTGDFQGAVEDYQQSLQSEQPGEQSVYVHIQLAVAKYKLGDIAGAEKKFKEAKRLFPTSAEIFNYHGEVLMDRQTFVDAQKSFDKAIEMDPKSPLPYINKAILFLQWKQDASKAEEQCRLALEQDPLCDIAYTQLAQLLCHQNRVDEALTIYDKAITVTRTEAEIMNVISCQEAAEAQRYVAIHYPDAMMQIGR